MTPEIVLNKFLELGIDKGYFTIRPLKDIDKSCCQSAEVEVIDFDSVKERLVKDFSAKILTPKSCDALKILPEMNRVDFIEMKQAPTHQK